MKRFLMSSIIFILFLSMQAQNRDDLMKEFEAFSKEAFKEYSDFRKKANDNYALFMREAWISYKAQPKIPIPKIPDHPKPPVIIPEKEINTKPEDKQLPYKEVIPTPVKIEQPKPLVTIPEINLPKEEWFDFSFFGTKCKVRLSNDDKFTLQKVDEDGVADVWNILSQEKYNNVLRDCLNIRAQLSLCDWAYLQMLGELAVTFYGGKTNEATLFQAFLYNQSGYKMRIARSATNKLYLLVASRHGIYKMSYFLIEGEKFYPLECKEERLFICNKVYPQEQSLSLEIGKEQKFTLSPTPVRKLASKRYPDVSVSVVSNKNLIDFFNTYPQSFINNDVTTKWQFYANTVLSRNVQDILYPILKNAIVGKSEQEAANILINFVQTAFTYGYDDKIWGGDRPFFADETIYYPYSDFEDRAILYSRLVRDLMGLDVVLLYYPGHLSTAVHFKTDIPGDYLLVNGIRYLVCDPTFIGANIGRTMPDVSNDEAKVVLLK